MKLGFLSSGVGEGDGLEVGLGLGIGFGVAIGDGDGNGVTSTAGMTTGVDLISLQMNFFPDFTHLRETFPTTLTCWAFLQIDPALGTPAAGSEIPMSTRTRVTIAVTDSDFCRFMAPFLPTSSKLPAVNSPRFLSAIAGVSGLR